MRLLAPRARCSARSVSSASGARAVALVAEHGSRDLLELVVGIVGELDVMRDARAEARVRLEEPLHPVGVAGEDHHEVVAVVLHHLQQDLDRLLPVVALVVGPVEVIGLVDEEHAAHRLLQHLLGLRRRVPDVLADQVVAGDADQVPLAHVAEPVQQPGHLQRHRGLAGARVAGEAHVQRRRLLRQPEPPPRPVDEQQRRGLADPLLDRRQPDQLGVELVEHLAHARALVLGAQVDRGRGDLADVLHRPSPCQAGQPVPRVGPAGRAQSTAWCV